LQQANKQQAKLLPKLPQNAAITFRKPANTQNDKLDNIYGAIYRQKLELDYSETSTYNVTVSDKLR